MTTASTFATIAPPAAPPVELLGQRFPANRRLQYSLARALCTQGAAAAPMCIGIMRSLLWQGVAFEEDARLFCAQLAINIGQTEVARAVSAGWQPSSLEHGRLFAVLATVLAQTAAAPLTDAFPEQAGLVARLLAEHPIDPAAGPILGIGPNASLALLMYPWAECGYAFFPLAPGEALRRFEGRKFASAVLADPSWPANVVASSLSEAAAAGVARISGLVPAGTPPPPGFQQIAGTKLEVDLTTSSLVSVTSSDPAQRSRAAAFVRYERR